MHRAISSTVLLLAISVMSGAAPGGAVSAQETPRFEPGTRIRVSSPALRYHVADLTIWDVVWADPGAAHRRRERGRVVGAVVSADADSLVFGLIRTERRVALPWPSIEQLEESLGGQRSRKRWIAGGALVGGVAGAALMAWQWDPEECQSDGSPGLIGGGLASCRKLSRPDAILNYVVASAVLGGGAGYFLGGTERWKSVALPSAIKLETDGVDRIGIAASTRF